VKNTNEVVVVAVSAVEEVADPESEPVVPPCTRALGQVLAPEENSPF
jgi:hypothetical protein